MGESRQNPRLEEIRRAGAICLGTTFLADLPRRRASGVARMEFRPLRAPGGEGFEIA